MNEVALRDKIELLQEACRPLPQVTMPTRHFLLEGMYLRQILIPAGTLFIGRVHKKPHYFLVLAGAAQVTTDEGFAVLRAGMVLMSPPGVKRAGITIQDTIFATIHRTEATRLEDIEGDLTEYDPAGRYGVGNEPRGLLS